MAEGLVRRSVPNDNSCLFYALAYLCEGAEASKAVETRLRKLVADIELNHPDPETRALFLEKPVAEYAEWIVNPFHWGGENEILTLATHYDVEVAVVSCESLSVLVYNQAEPGAERKGRAFILYTGQHYDPLVGAANADVPTAEELKVFPVNTTACQRPSLLGCVFLTPMCRCVFRSGRIVRRRGWRLPARTTQRRRVARSRSA